jgi:hypothetical protein
VKLSPVHRGRRELDEGDPEIARLALAPRLGHSPDRSGETLGWLTSLTGPAHGRDMEQQGGVEHRLVLDPPLSLPPRDEARCGDRVREPADFVLGHSPVS